MTDFEYQQHRIRQWIMRQGEQIYYPTQAERKIIRKLLKDMPVLFPELLYRYGLRLLYLYNQQKGGEHDKTFCDCLDRMIEKFNAATGASLVNDYGLGEKKRKQENR